MYAPAMILKILIIHLIDALINMEVMFDLPAIFRIKLKLYFEFYFILCN